MPRGVKNVDLRQLARSGGHGYANHDVPVSDPESVFFQFRASDANLTLLLADLLEDFVVDRSRRLIRCLGVRAFVIVDHAFL